MSGLFTNDIPSFPISPTDTLHLTLSIENNISSNPSHFQVAELVFNGSELYKMVEENPDQNALTVQNEASEWSFGLQDKFWIIKSVVIYMPAAQLAKFTKD